MRRAAILIALAAVSVCAYALPRSLVLDLDEYFHDADGDPLEYGVQVAPPGIVSATLSGPILTIRGRSAGEARVSVRACDDELACSEWWTFTVTVKPRPRPPRQPVPPGPINTCTPHETWSYDAIGDICGCTEDWDGNREPMRVLRFEDGRSVCGLPRR